MPRDISKNRKSVRGKCAVSPKGNHVVGPDDFAYEDAFDAVFEPGKAAVYRAQSDVLMMLRMVLTTVKGKPAEKAAHLGISCARFDALLESEAINVFTLVDLIKIAARAGLNPTMRFNSGNDNRHYKIVNHRKGH